MFHRFNSTKVSFTFRDFSMISSINEETSQASFHRLDYSTDASDSSTNQTTSNTHYAATPNTSSSENLRPRFTQSAQPAKKMRIERPTVNELTVRPYEGPTATAQSYSSEEERPTSPMIAIVRDKIPIGAPYR